LKRSNRLVLLIGIFLAIVAFIGVIALSQGTAQPTTPVAPTELPTVFAKADIPLGTKVRADQVELRNWPIPQRSESAFNDVSLVVGKIVREYVSAGAQLTAVTFTGGSTGQVLNLDVPQGQRAMTLQVDQVSGVGTVIKTGDYVDLIVGLTGDQFPVITINPADDSITPVSGLSSISVKLLLQGMQVIGTLLPPPPVDETGQPAPPGQPVALTGQQMIVFLSVTPAQAEVIKFAQLNSSISLLLRSPDDFVDADGNPIVAIPDDTSGVILKTLVDVYGVLPPEVVETVVPTAN
jgi:pilus assembly protein CpaB